MINRDLISRLCSAVPDTQCPITQMYVYGKWLTSDSTKIAKWYYLAPNQGHIKAQLQLGMLY
jgi:TPR repeat protein